MRMPYYKAELADIVVEADTKEEGEKKIFKLLFDEWPVLSVEEVHRHPDRDEDERREIEYWQGLLEKIEDTLEDTSMWVGVEVYGLMVQGVYLFTTEKEGYDWYEDYTGFKLGTLYDEHGNCLDKDYDQTKLFCISKKTLFSALKDLQEA